MGGAAIFTAVVVVVLVLGTYLLQAAILAVQAGIWIAAWGARLAFCLVMALGWGLWWLVRPREAMTALRRAQATQERC